MALKCIRIESLLQQELCFSRVMKTVGALRGGDNFLVCSKGAAIVKHIAGLLFAAIGLVSIPPAMAADTNSRCIEGEMLPNDLTGIRPTRTAICPYGFDEFVRRLTIFSTDKLANDNVENVEMAFDIPEMTTSHDAPRNTYYAMVLSGIGGWRAYVTAEEAFYPLNEGPARFAPGLRPKRLYDPKDPNLRISLRVNIDILGTSPTLDPGHCIPVTPLLDALVNSGWKDISLKSPTPTDGGERSTVYGSAEKQVVTSGPRGRCTRHITLIQAPV